MPFGRFAERDLVERQAQVSRIEFLACASAASDALIQTFTEM